MKTENKKEEIYSVLWAACDTFRGVIDASEYKNYILVMLFLKYISDVWAEHYENLLKKLKDEERVRRKLEKGAFLSTGRQ